MSFIFFFVTFFLSSETIAESKYRFSLQPIQLNDCQLTNSRKELREFLKWVNDMAPFLEQYTANADSLTSDLEEMYLNNNKTAFVGLDIMRDIFETISDYCYPYQDSTAINAILHFAMSASLTQQLGERLAKELVDLHEASPNNFEATANGKKLIPMAEMDVYNNYVGIEYGLRFKGTPEDRLPKEFFLELGTKLFLEGKLKAIAAPRLSQYCLFPKSKFQGPPLKEHLMSLNDKRIFEHYTLVKLAKARSLPKENLLTNEDIQSVVNYQEHNADPLYQKLQKYKAAVDYCCTTNNGVAERL